MKILSSFDNIKLPIKMSIIALFALIGIAIPTYFYAQLSLGEQSTDEIELAGISPASEVIVLKKLLAEHRGLSARLFGGDESVVGQLSTKGSEIDRQISLLRSDLKAVTNDNALTGKVDDLNNTWKQVQSKVSSRQYDRVSSFAEHSDLLSDGDALISNILKDFLLIYERTPAIYHVIVANFENLPRLANALGKVRGSAAGVLANGNITNAEVGVIRGLLNTVSTPARDFDYNMHSAFDADDRFNQLSITSADIDNKITELVLLTKQEVLKGGELSYTSNRFFEQFTTVIDELYALHEASLSMVRDQITERVEESIVQRRNAFVAIGILFIISSFIGFIIIRSLSSATKSLITSFKRISEGDFEIDFNLSRKDEMGILESELSILTQQLRDAAVVAQEASKVKQALDSSSTCFMMLNSEREIVYMNHAVAQLMRSSEPAIRKDLPQFNSESLIGTRIDSFHYDPANQRAMLEQLKTQHKAHLELGGKSFQLNITPVTGEDGSDLGNTVEWLDRTTEINAEKEIANMVTASLAGDFTLRINEENKVGFMLTMSKGLNQFVETTESGLNDVCNILLALSEGDLTKRITTEYQGTFNDLKDYCNTTSANLADVIDRIRVASDTINSAATEIAQGNSDLSTRTEQQASSLEETASSMEEITSTVRLNADNAKQANGLASQASQVAGSGGKLIQEVVLTMASINESSRKISDIIGVIDGIAFQTNILALNAAVEAARAGEQGRGFAVVASEVRTLAQRSANAAKDIKDLISDSVSKVESGNSLVNQSGDTMKEIVVSIQRVNDIMSEIAAASAEQASGIDEVSKAVIQMDEMTQQNAALVEEASAAAESMRAQASDLTERVGTFRLDSSDLRSSGASIEHKSISNESRYKNPVSKQIDELPFVMSPAESRQASRKVIPAKSDDDEWESF